MFTNGFHKVGYAEGSIVQRISHEDFKENLASPEILNRLEKFAKNIQAIAPRSDEFLYFSIIFLKAAESALIDNNGDPIKIGKEKSWGYFDDNWRWHGNVKPHKNKNGDIFPAAELRKAARNWIGKPLCVDHLSDNVDGIRGIILDTHYDEKLMQVVGLCALDKINYPELARKVTTGVVRYGSMGTAVATSICSDCGKKATNASEYCPCILQKKSWGEINVGLSPIEYSLVVQPAEPGAILLRCFASIKKHEQELNSYGVSVDSLPNVLTAEQANDLDLLLNSVCGENNCSLEQRHKIIQSYLDNNKITKKASLNKTASLNKSSDYNKELLLDLARFQDVLGTTLKEDPEIYERFFGENIKDILNQDSQSEQFSSHQNSSGSSGLVPKDDHDVSDYTGTSSSGMMSSVNEPIVDSFSGTGVGPENVFANKMEDNNKKISSIMEEIMNESRMRKRAALRRKFAYPQGGSDSAVEPSTYKDEGAASNKIREEDKHMSQTGNMGGDDGLFPGDKEIKEKQLRAEERKNMEKKRAYHQGGSDSAVEPSTYKSEDYQKYWDMDKHMQQTKSMGGDDGLFPGDESIKQQQKRAGYQGPALSTKFKQRRSLDGSINKAASCFEVYSGNKLVIAATAGDIFKNSLEKNWDWITSKDYAKAVVAEIREKGLDYVGKILTKKGQELPPLPEATEPAELAAPAEGDLGEVPMELPEEGGMEELDESPKTAIENALVDMEDTIEQIRTSLSDLGGGEDVDVNVNVGGGASDVSEEKLALSRNIFDQLKMVLAEAKDSADELAMLSATYDSVKKISSIQKRDIAALTNDALQDYSNIIGQSKSLISMANIIAKTLVKTSEYSEVSKEENMAKDQPQKDSPKETEKKKEVSKENSAMDKEEDELVAKAMLLRKQKRQMLLKKAEEKMEQESCAKDEELENKAHDGIGMKENAPVSGVTKDTAEDIAKRQPTGGDHKPAPSKGNQDAKQFDSYMSTPSRQVAEKSVTSVKQHAADDDLSDVHEIAEDEAKEEVDEHEKDMHKKENDAKDTEGTGLQSKMATAFMKKKAEEEAENYRAKLRRAYDIGMEMQRKGMIPATRPALDRQVDDILSFDEKSFESFKRTVASIKKEASDNSLNVGIISEQESEVKESSVGKNTGGINAKTLATLWEK